MCFIIQLVTERGMHLEMIFGYSNVFTQLYIECLDRYLIFLILSKYFKKKKCILSLINKYIFDKYILLILNIIVITRFLAYNELCTC